MEQIGRYEIDAELGRGAMGVVYRARDPRIGREVAIKTIKPADQADADETEGLRERLFREAQSAGRLSHPGIVTIFDVDEQDGLVYIAMELVEGQTLDRHAAAAGGGAQSLDFAIDLLLQVGAALDYAHRRGIVHRDVKPSNIMISPDGVKIMDFGVARIASSQLTRTGAVVGTPNYMSPEQVKGEEIDGRSDQFSLGAVAYELLTGKKPFQSSSLTSTIFRIVSADPALPRQLNPKIPLPLQKAVLRALAKDPGGRFATCSEFAETAAEQSRAGGGNVVLSAAFADSGGGETMAADPARQEATRADVRLAGAPAEGTSAAAGAGKDAPAGKAGERGHPKPAEASPILPESARKAPGSEPPPKQAAVLPPRRFEPERRSRWPLAVFLLLLAATGGLSLFLYNNPNLLDDPGRLLRVVLGIEPQEESGAPRAAAGGREAPAAPAVEPQAAPGGSGAEAGPLVPAPSPKPLPGKELKSAGRGGAAAVEAGSEPAQAASAPAAPPVSAPDSDEAGSPAAEEPAVEKPAEAAEKAAAAPVPVPAPVTFRSNAPGARIAIDRRAEWTCTAPCAPMNLPAGRHTARVTLNGYRPQQRAFDVGPKPLEIAFALQPLRAILVITSRPPDAGIHIDGRDTGRRTPARIAVAPGRRAVRVVKGGLSAERTIEAADEGLQSLSFTLGSR